MSKNLYDTLGVDKKASAQEIRQAFKDKAKKHHTDKGGDHEKMTELNHAYGILKSPTKKSRYDETGQEQETPFDVKFTEIIQNVFIHIIEENDVDTKDLIAELRNYIKVAINENYKKNKITKKKLEKLEKVKGRIEGKDGRIARIIEMNIYEIKILLKLEEENIKFLKDCQEVVNDYRYKVDDKVITEGYWTIKG